MKKFALVLLALIAFGSCPAWATDAQPRPEFPARRWNGTTQMQLTNTAAHLRWYRMVTGVDTTSAEKGNCTYTPATGYWWFEPTHSGTYEIWDTHPTTHLPVNGWTAQSIFIPSESGGTGDITEVNNNGINGGYLTVSNPTGPGIVVFGVNLGDESTAASFDGRYANEGVANEVSGTMLQDGACGVSKLNAGSAPSFGYVLKASGPTTMAWAPAGSGGTVTSVGVGANGFLNLTGTPTTNPTLEFDLTDGDSRYVNESQTTHTLGSSPSTAGSLKLYTGSTGALTLQPTAYLNDWSFFFPAGPASATEMALVADGTGGFTKWKSASGTGTVTSVNNTDGWIDITANTTTPYLTFDTAMLDARMIQAFGGGGPMETQSIFTTGDITGRGLQGTSSLTIGTASSGNPGNVYLNNTYGRANQIIPSTGNTDYSTVFKMPYNDPMPNSVLRANDTATPMWDISLTMAGQIWGDLGVSCQELDIRSNAAYPGKVLGLFCSPIQESGSNWYTFPYHIPATGGTLHLVPISANNWQITVDGPNSGKALDEDTLHVDMGRGWNESFMKYIVDQNYQDGDSTYKANNQDNSHMAVDTSLIATREWVATQYGGGPVLIAADTLRISSRRNGWYYSNQYFSKYVPGVEVGDVVVWSPESGGLTVLGAVEGMKVVSADSVRMRVNSTDGNGYILDFTVTRR